MRAATLACAGAVVLLVAWGMARDLPAHAESATVLQAHASTTVAQATATASIVTALPPSEDQPPRGWAAALWWLLIPIALAVILAAAWSQWRTTQDPVSTFGPWWLHALRRRDERRGRDEDF